MNYSPDQLEMMRLGQANLARMNDLQMARRAREPMPAQGGGIDPTLLATMMQAPGAAYQQNNAMQQQRQQQNQNTMNNAMRAYDMMNAGSVSGGGGIGGGMASPSFMGGEGAGFTGAGSIGGYSTSIGGLGASTAGASSPAFGAAGASSYGLGGGAATGGAAAGGAGAGGGFGGAMASGGPWAAMAAAIAGGKLWQDKEGSNSTGRILHGALMPSASQYIEDAKQGEWRGIGASLLGLPFLNGFFSSDEAVETAPEWKAPLVNMMGM